MYIIKKFNKVLALLLVISVTILIFPIQTYATIPSQRKFSIQRFDSKSIKITENKITTLLKETETNNSITVTLKDNKNNTTSFFKYDKITGNIYSSETNQTVNISKLIEDNNLTKNTEQLQNSTKLKLKNKAYSTTRVIKKISYKKLSKLVTTTSGIASIAGAILTILGACGITVVNPVAGVISVLGGIITFIQYKIGAGSPKHGLKIILNKHKYKRSRGGKVRYLTRYSIHSIKTY